MAARRSKAMKRHKVTITTASDGTATGYTPVISGEIMQVEYVKTDFANGVDFAITGEDTGIGIWTQSDVNASAVVAPRHPTHSQAGAAALYASGGVGVLAPIAIARDRVNITIAQGGDTKTGTFHVLVK
jgi:hypothetical protein